MCSKGDRWVSKKKIQFTTLVWYCFIIIILCCRASQLSNSQDDMLMNDEIKEDIDENIVEPICILSCDTNDQIQPM